MNKSVIAFPFCFADIYCLLDFAALTASLLLHLRLPQSPRMGRLWELKPHSQSQPRAPGNFLSLPSSVISSLYIMLLYKQQLSGDLGHDSEILPTGLVSQAAVSFSKPSQGGSSVRKTLHRLSILCLRDLWSSILQEQALNSVYLL